MNRLTGRRLKELFATIITIIVLLFTSCTPSLRLMTGEKINSNCVQKIDFQIFSKYFEIPENYKVINRIRTRGNLLKEYNVDKSMNLIRKGACSLGGNSIKIIDIISPSLLGSKSYDIIADVLSSDQTEDFNFSIKDNSLPVEPQFCYVKIYRPWNPYGSGVSYPIYLGDEYICSINDNNRITVQLKNRYQEQNLQIECNGKLFPVHLNFEKGAVNYVSCKVGNMGNPVLKVLSDMEGMEKFDK